MRILLIAPPITHGDKLQTRVRGCMPPLDLLYLAAYLRKTGCEVRVLDLYAKEMPLNSLLDYIDEFSAQIVGFSTYTANIDRVFIMARNIKQRSPQIKIVLGGIHASYLADLCLKRDFIDFVVQGEGEYTFSELATAIEKDDGYDKVNGIAFMKNGTVYQTKPRALIADLDQLPIPAYDLIDFKDYYLAVTRAVSDKKVASILTMRGCPYGCSFCSHSYGYGCSVRMRSVDRVIEEMKILYHDYGIREMQIEDSSFTCHPERVKKICSRIIDSGMKIIWNCNIRADTGSEELFRQMSRAGCRRVLLGVESGQQRILDRMNKGITIEQVRNTVRWVKKCGIRINCAFLLGTPGETYESAQKTGQFALELDPDYVMFSVLVPSVGSLLFDQGIAEKQIDRSSVEGADYITVYSQRLPLAQMSQINREELFRLMEKFTKQFYLRPSYIVKRLISIRSWGEIARILYGVLLIFSHQMHFLNTIVINRSKAGISRLGKFANRFKRLCLLYRIFVRRMNFKAYARLSAYFILRNVFRKKIPVSVMICLTYKCQCACVHCSVYTHERQQEEFLSTQDVKRVIDQAYRIGVVKIGFTGGEPLLRKDIVELVNYAYERGFSTSIDTNGVLLDDNMAIKLKTAGLSNINVSLDHPEEKNHDRLRKLKGCFKKAAAGIKKCAEISLPVIVSTYITNRAVKDRELDRICDLARKIKATAVRVLFPIYSGKLNNKRRNMLSEEYKRRFFEHYADPAFVYSESPLFDFTSGEVECSAKKKLSIYITAYGDVKYCYVCGNILGNIRDLSLKGILEKDSYFSQDKDVDIDCSCLA